MPIDEPASAIAEVPSPSRRGVFAAGLALFVAFALTRWIAIPADVTESDDVLFCFAVEKFDLSRHHPHPPGYPVYVALGKLVAALGADSFTALTWLGLAASCSAVWPLYRLARDLPRAPRPLAYAACALYGACPVVWLHSGAALSDVPGTAVALWVAWLLWRVVQQGNLVAGKRFYVLAAGIAAAGIGIRPQLAVVFIPLLALTGVLGRVGLRTIMVSIIVAAGVCAAWLVPMVWVSGGWSPFREHFAVQTEWYLRYDTAMGEPTSTWQDRIAYWVNLWGAAATHWPIVALIVVGVVRLCATGRRAGAFLIAWLLPYAWFVLVAHSPATPRYALPAVAPLVLLATAALVGIPRVGTVMAALIAMGLAVQGGGLVWRFHAERIPPLQAVSWVASRAAPGESLLLDAGLEVVVGRHEAGLPWTIVRGPAEEHAPGGAVAWLLTAHPRADREAAFSLAWGGRRYRLFTRERFQSAYVYRLSSGSLGK